MKPEHPPALTTADLELLLVEVERSAEPAGHQPNPDAVDRARRILTEETSLNDARVEIELKYKDDSEA